jgi:hypothetical protein
MSAASFCAIESRAVCSCCLTASNSATNSSSGAHSPSLALPSSPPAATRAYVYGCLPSRDHELEGPYVDVDSVVAKLLQLYALFELRILHAEKSPTGFTSVDDQY